MGCSGCNAKRDLDRPAMLTVYDWLNDIPDTTDESNIVEIRFKGTRKEFFVNEDHIPLKRDELVVVSCSPGHDVGTVSLTGKLAELQFKRKVKKPDRYEWNKIYRKATPADVIKWEEAKAREQKVMIRARQIAKELRLDMKIGDVEFRGDNNKAIFYYIADDRVDFRELIKVYAKEFAIKIEMKQIGARQEAGRIGGIGSCGRALCCSTWRTDFSSVTSEAAVKQGLSPNAEKMAGRCGKLKCCLTYELDHYLEALEDFPNELLAIETDKGLAKHFKTDILQKKVWYIYDQSEGGRVFVLDLEDVKRFLNMNKRGQRPSLEGYKEPEAKKENMMNVGELDQKLFTNPNKDKKRRDRNRRAQNTRQAGEKPVVVKQGEVRSQEAKPQEPKPAETNTGEASQREERPNRNRHHRNRPKGPRPERKQE
ncbi:MAG TPA: regulatory iron-sulfur-containing complex subunit RicT [Prolixibacteraceae bacterium]|nr:regulatory iron-sulfur-containing complex subunit RicT [Prolixibacteraceae bacterium]HPR85575.1 regulatory iron-sulfur-containing complex subunit RicT [Prolixibacteraceae bacterium]